MARLIGALVVLLALSQTVAADKVVIGTGGETGVYFATGQALCKVLSGAGTECAAPASKGSVANLKALAAGNIQLAMAQSDWQFHAVKGSSEWNGPVLSGLRVVFAVYAEPVHIVVNRDAGIRRWNDLKGKRVNIGNPGSGQRKTMQQMLDARRWKLEFFGAVSELPSSEQVDAFCGGKFDAFVYTVGVPNRAMRRAVAECNGNLIEPDRTTVRKLATAARPYYAKVDIPKGTYWEGQKKVDTFGVMATLVTTKDANPGVIEALVKGVFENFDSFKTMHPAYAGSTPEMMVSEGISAPLHPAAKAYYKSKGWLK